MRFKILVLGFALVLAMPAAAAESAAPWAPPQPASFGDVLSLLQGSLGSLGNVIAPAVIPEPSRRRFRGLAAGYDVVADVCHSAR